MVVLPHRFAPTFGEAAVYCEPDEVPDTIRTLHEDRSRLREQSARGPEFVRRHHGHERFAERVIQLATQG